MFDRTKNLISAGIAGLAALFAESILQPDNWLPSNNAKRSRMGSYGKPNPEGHNAKSRYAPPRSRYLRMAPNWSNPDRLMARGNPLASDNYGNLLGVNVYDLPRVPYGALLGYFDPDGVHAEIETKARPHRSKADNQIRFARTKGNNGPTINKRLRAKFNAGKGGGRQAAALGIML